MRDFGNRNPNPEGCHPGLVSLIPTRHRASHISNKKILMKTPARILSLIYLSTAVHVSAAHYQVYLLGGQSNGNGRADAAQLVAPLDAAQTDVRFYWHRTQAADNVGSLLEDQWTDLAPGSGHGTGAPVYAKEFGSEVSFGRAMADAKPADNIAIIKYTHGGTTLYNDWSATGTQYTTFVPTVQAALTALTTAGHTYELRGMLWVQGETDSNNATGSDNYQTNLTNLIARMRTDLNGGQPFPFVLSTLSNSQYTNITTVGSGPYKVRLAQETVAAADPTVGIVITDGYSVRSDVIHFDHTALVALGQGMATQMQSLETAATTSLIHHWRFDADLNDAAGAHHGTAAGDVVLTAGAGGKFGEAVTLDGAGDYVQVGQSSLPATDFTLTAWIKRDTAGDYMYVAGTQLSGTAGAFLRVEPATGSATANNALFANLLPPATSLRAWSAAGTIPLNQWTHVAMTVSSTAGLTIYINGTAAGTDAAATTHTTHDNFRIGARPDGTSLYFDGLIDDVAIFDGVLTSTQLGNVIALGAANFATFDADRSARTTGVFDENIDATNGLDIEIPASTLGAFKTSVLAAHNNDLGGVIDWETGVVATLSVTTSANNSLSSVAASYGAGAGNVLLVTFDRSMDLYTNDINSQVSVLSRAGSFHNAIIAGGGNDPVGLQYTMTFSNADVIELGAAIPSRSTYGALGVDFRATGTFSGGGSEVIDFTAGGTVGTGDTFLHFTAPANQTIAAVSVVFVDDNGQALANGQRRPVLDDLGFIVAAAPSNTFAAWIGNPVFGIDPAEQGFGDDPDGDDLVNGLEAWFGSHPGEFNAGLANLITNGATTTFTHPRNENPPSGLTGFYEWSPNLLDWYAGDGSDGPFEGPTVTISPNSVGATTTVTATTSEALGRIFVRAGVTGN